MKEIKKALLCMSAMVVAVLSVSCTDSDYDLGKLDDDSGSISLGENISVPLGTFTMLLSELTGLSSESASQGAPSSRATATQHSTADIPSVSAEMFDVSAADLDDLNSFDFIAKLKDREKTTILCWMSGLSMDFGLKLVLYGGNGSWVKEYSAPVKIDAGQYGLFKIQLAGADVRDILEGLAKIAFVFDFSACKAAGGTVEFSADDTVTAGISFSSIDMSLDEAAAQLAVFQGIPASRIATGEFVSAADTKIFCGTADEYMAMNGNARYDTVIITDRVTQCFALASCVKTAVFKNAEALFRDNFAACAIEKVCANRAEVIFEQTFTDKDKLTELLLPNVTDVTSFKGCSSLTRIALPRLSNAYDSMFEGCTALSTVIWPANVPFVPKNLFGETQIWSKTPNDAKTNTWTKQ